MVSSSSSRSRRKAAGSISAEFETPEANIVTPGVANVRVANAFASNPFPTIKLELHAMVSVSRMDSNSTPILNCYCILRLKTSVAPQGAKVPNQQFVRADSSAVVVGNVLATH
jgi:hypothetical protein